MAPVDRDRIIGVDVLRVGARKPGPAGLRVRLYRPRLYKIAEGALPSIRAGHDLFLNDPDGGAEYRREEDAGQYQSEHALTARPPGDDLIPLDHQRKRYEDRQERDHRHDRYERVREQV